MRRKRISLSYLDKQILRILLSPDGGKETSKAIAKNLNIPTTTVQRHRRKMEDNWLTMNYDFDLKHYGWRRVLFFVATANGKTAAIANNLGKLNHVISVDKSIGQFMIDLHLLAVVRDNGEILELIEHIKSMDGVKEAMWSEPVQTMVRKAAVPEDVIDSL
jgi:DNA-binding Lrp family transcriptional regulator